jgi:hypothetical protein
MMKVIFAGPSIAGLSPEDMRGLCVRPPAKCGDIYEAAQDGATLIGLIDGLFETCRSPWHKEILHALANGLEVLGASSIGAIRAAELRPFGMIGIGVVTRLFARGTLTRDDEVALLHGPAETGYLPLTEALVNMRVTLRRATRSGLISRDEERSLLHVAQSMFYKDRTYESLLASIGGCLSQHSLDLLTGWLPSNKVDAKRDDAVRLIQVVRRSSRLKKRRSNPSFVPTLFWREFISAGPHAPFPLEQATSR